MLPIRTLGGILSSTQAPTLTLSSDGAATVSIGDTVTLTATNVTSSVSVTIARVSGPSATLSPSSVTVAPGDLVKTSSATATSAGTLTPQASATIGGTLVTSNVLSIVVGEAPAAPVAGNPQVTLISSASGSLPFTAGFSFRQGDIPSGSGIVVSGATAQATIKTTWPDGSAKIAILAGTYVSAGAAVTITMSTGAASTGTALTTSDLQAALTDAVTVDAGAFGSASWTGTDWASPFITWVSGHRMSSWIYRKQVGSDAHLVAWLEVRLWSSGAVEVLPWIENGYLLVTGPTNKSATTSVSLKIEQLQRHFNIINFCC